MYNANNRQSRFMSGAARSSSLIATGSKSFASQYNLLVEIQMFLDFFLNLGRSGFSTSKMHNKAARTYSDREN